MIEAAGGVVWRVVDERLEVLVVHRPRYDDWSLPKGKLDAGESASEGALREVREESGLRCRLGGKLAEVRYRDRKGRPKRVRYWAMEPMGGRFRPNDEVDRIRWVRADKVDRILTYDHDADVVAVLTRSLRPAG